MNDQSTWQETAGHLQVVNPVEELSQIKGVFAGSREEAIRSGVVLEQLRFEVNLPFLPSEERTERGVGGLQSKVYGISVMPSAGGLFAGLFEGTAPY